MASSTKKSFTASDVLAIAKLANIPITDDEATKLAKGFTTTIRVIDKLNELKTDNVEPTHQVTGLVNIFREDKVEEKRMLTQVEALSNAKKKHNGYFVVDQILED